MIKGPTKKKHVRDLLTKIDESYYEGPMLCLIKCIQEYKRVKVFLFYYIFLEKTKLFK